MPALNMGLRNLPTTTTMFSTKLWRELYWPRRFQYLQLQGRGVQNAGLQESVRLLRLIRLTLVGVHEIAAGEVKVEA